MTYESLALVAVFILLSLSAIFSAAETAITGSSRARLHKLKVGGNKKAETVLALKKDKERFIGTILIGNNATNIVASALVTGLAIDYFDTQGVAAVTALLTIFVLIFCEMLPKTYAFENAETSALRLAGITRLFIIIFSPVINIFKIIVNYVLKILHLHHHHHAGEIAEEEIRGAIELHHHEGSMQKDDRDMLGSILDLGDMEVAEIMIHRKNMVSLDLNLEPTQMIDKILSDYTHTRIPVWVDNIDNIVGILNVKDLLVLYANKKENITRDDIQKIVSSPWFIPDTGLVKDQLHEFRRRRTHVAIVIDEYGALMGMLTLEDIIEEIVGHIEDEHDLVKHSIIKVAEDSYVVNGEETLRDINKRFNLNLPDSEASTVAGLIIYEAERIPEKGEVFFIDKVKFEVVEKSENKISLVRMSFDGA